VLPSKSNSNLLKEILIDSLLVGQPQCSRSYLNLTHTISRGMIPHNRIVIFVGFIVALLLIVGVVLYATRKRAIEGFGPLTVRNEFANRNNEYFGKKFNRALFYNDGLENSMKDVAKMFSLTDVLTSKNGPVDISNFFDRDPFPGIRANNQECAKVLEPKFLPARNDTNGSGCGWWYVDDDNKPSIGANGTELGPYNNSELDGSHAGGKWMWDLKAAQKMEDVKRCRRIRTCDVADLVPGRCGFCPALNKGVPVHSSGVSVYENDAALNCGSVAITNPANCPRPEPPNTPDGKPPPQIMLLCDPNPATGKLSNQCLIALAKGAGCTEAGAIISILSGDAKGYYGQPGMNNIKFNMAKRVLMEDTSISSNNEYFGFGSCTRSEALGYYNTIFKLSRTASTKKARGAANLFAFGLDFDECEMADSQSGPFYLHCLQRAAAEAGCQPDGTEYPKDSNKGNYDSKTWGGVSDYFNKLRDDMNSGDINVQVAATKQCLGIDVAKPPADCGDSAGLSVYVYRWEYEWQIGEGGVPGGKISRATFFGRMALPTYPEINNNGPYTPFNIGTDRIYLRFRARIKSNAEITTRYYVFTDDGVSLIAGAPMEGGKNILRKWWDQGPTGYETSSFVIRTNSSEEITTDWYNNYGGYVILHKLWLAGSFQQIPASMIEQVQPTGYPIARWDFYEGIIQDRCRTLDSEVMGNVPIETISGMKCARFQGQSYIRIMNPIATTAFKSITMTICVNQAPGGWPRPWEFNNTPFGASWCDDSLFGCLSPGNNLGVGFYSKKGCGGPDMWSGGGTMTVGKWYHYAWVLDDDLRGMTIYINGVVAKNFRSESFNLLQNKTFANCYIFNSVERFDKDVGVGWFRIFDYSLTKEDVAMDSRNGWFTKKQFAPSVGSGWDRVSVSHTQG